MMVERILQRHARLLFGASTLLLVVIYLIVGGVYRPQNLDDGWTLSFLYQYHLHGVEHDTVFGNVVSSTGGQDGVFYFAKIQSIVYGAILDFAGWTQSAAHTVSTLLIGASAAIWGLIAHRLTSRRALSAAIVLLLLFTEPFFGPANQSRAEALAFFFASAAFALYVFEFPLFSGLLVGLAFEVHPTGLFAAIYVASALFAKASSSNIKNTIFSRSTALLFAGLILGFGIYVLLHAEAISTLPQVLTAGNSGDNLLVAYFIKTKYLRHVPELVFFLLTVGIFIAKKYWRDTASLSWLLLATGCSILVIHRESVHYALYFYAPLMLTSLWVADRHKKLHLTVALCLAFFTAQLGVVYYLNHSYSFDAYSVAIAKAVPADNLAVVGTSNDWFVFKERVFYAYTYGAEAFNAVAPNEFYLIQNDSPYASFPQYGFYENIDRNFTCSKISGFTLGGEKVQVAHCKR